MRAIVIIKAGGVQNLLHTQITIPLISANEVLVKVNSISINPVDVKTRSSEGMLTGLLGDTNLPILGWDISGTVIETGKEVNEFKKGDEVFGMINFPGQGKAYAEYVAAPSRHLAIKPENVSHEEAAAASLAALTAWQALITNAKIKAGDKVLIHAAAGGVGHYAVQIAKNKGAHIICTGSVKNKEFILGLGADEFIDYQTTRFEDVVRHVDFVFDTVGCEIYDRSLLTLKKDGLIITLHPLSNEQQEKTKSLELTGYRIVVSSNGRDMNKIANLLQQKKIISHVSHSFPFNQMADAHLQIESGRTRGKVVVKL
jgi:NADPH:quinone reductase-like Zn-dependent oxidoreductase